MPKEATVTRDSKKVGIVVNLRHGGSHFHYPLNTTWRWCFVLGVRMLEILEAEVVIAQFNGEEVGTVQGPCSTQPLWRTPEYPV